MKINSFKKAIAFLALLTFSCAVALAESPQPCPAPTQPDSNSPVCEVKGPDAAPKPLDARGLMERLSKKLNLTDEQKTAIQQIVADEAKEIQKIRENSRKQINAVLTPEQQEEFGEIKVKARHHRMREHAGKRIEILAEKLNLTEEQTAAMKPIFAAEANDIKAIWQDKSLSKEQKRSKIADIRKSVKEKINTIMTPEQQAQLAELKEPAERMRHHRMGPGLRHKRFEHLPPPPPEEQGPTDSNP